MTAQDDRPERIHAAGASPEDVSAAREFYTAGMPGQYPEPDGGDFDLLLDLSGRVVWPEVWLSEGLDAKTRSLCTIAALTALGRPQVAGHIRAARARGATRREIAEVITQMAIYAGWPAAMMAKAAAEEVFAASVTDDPVDANDRADPTDSTAT
jgi:alkylhydroperoxidase/carboxymuconolactone decarboxylase family protein YurZ